MKLTAAALIILFVLVMVGFGSSASWKDGSNSISGLIDFRAKIADTMNSINHDKESGINVNDEYPGEGLKANAPSANSSAGNASAISSSALNSFINDSSPFTLEKNADSSLINQSEDNETKSILAAKMSINSRDFLSTGSTFSHSSSISPAAVHFNNQGSFNGMWSMEASNHGFGRNGINDRIELSGNFDVQKSVSFKG